MTGLEQIRRVEGLVGQATLEHLAALWPSPLHQSGFTCPTCGPTANAYTVDEIQWRCLGKRDELKWVRPLPTPCDGGTVFALRALVLANRVLLERFLALFDPADV